MKTAGENPNHWVLKTGTQSMARTATILLNLIGVLLSTIKIRTELG
jgi:hypothetical protein